MSDEVVLLRAALAFVVGGCFVAGMTWAAAHLGSRTGGVLLGLPSMTFLGLSFLAWQGGGTAVRDGGVGMPAILGAVTIYLLAFLRGHKVGGMATAYAAAVAAWLAVAVPVSLWAPTGQAAPLLLGCALFVGAAYVTRRTPHRTTARTQPRAATLALRAAAAGTGCAATVLVAAEAGAVWGGVVASFPAVYSASLFFLVNEHGIDFVASSVRSMLFGVMANIVFVSVAVATVTHLPSFAALALGYAAALAFAAVAIRFLLGSAAPAKAYEPDLAAATATRG